MRETCAQVDTRIRFVGVIKLSYQFVGGEVPREEPGEAEAEFEGFDVAAVVPEEPVCMAVKEGTDLCGVDAGDIHGVMVEGNVGW